MEKKTEIVENFKKAITSTVKSIIGDQNIEVTFGAGGDKKNNKTINLPSLKSINNIDDYIKTRALADSEALKIRCSDFNIYKNFEPQGNMSKLLYAVAEKVRYENIGSSYFLGIKENLNQYYKIKAKQKNDSKDDDSEFIDAFENYLRDKIFKSSSNKEIENKYKKYKKKLDDKLRNQIDFLNESIFADIISLKPGIASFLNFTSVMPLKRSSPPHSLLNSSIEVTDNVKVCDIASSKRVPGITG